MIHAQFGAQYRTLPITYVTQDELLGTAHALSLCEPLIRGRFLVLMGDDLHGAGDIARTLTHEWAWLVHRISGSFSGGLIHADTSGKVTAVTEGTYKEVSGFMNTNLFVLGREYFSYPMVPIKDGAEFGLPQTVALVAQEIPIVVVEAQEWQQVTDLEDIARLEAQFYKGQ